MDTTTNGALMSESSIPQQITNTARKPDPIELLTMLGGGAGAGIEAQEKRGQSEVVRSEQLPVRSGGDQQYLDLGFTFGEADKRDPLFRPATLPAGWKKQATDHSMWTEIVDELGRKRVAIFYKAAFYDRDAHMYLETPHSYVASELYHERMPVLDDVWLTADIARAELEALAVRADKDAAEAKEFAERRDEGSKYWTERVGTAKAEAAAARKMAEAI
jgi:hypothetical protein